MTEPPAPHDPNGWRRLPNAPQAGTIVDAGQLRSREACELRFGRGRSAFSAILVRTQHGPRAYVNRCPHFGLPLNSDPDAFIGEQGLLRCFRHFALFQREDGLCIAGACSGASLEAIPLVDCGEGVLRIG